MSNIRNTAIHDYRDSLLNDLRTAQKDVTDAERMRDRGDWVLGSPARIAKFKQRVVDAESKLAAHEAKHGAPR